MVVFMFKIQCLLKKKLFFNCLKCKFFKISLDDSIYHRLSVRLLACVLVSAGGASPLLLLRMCYGLWKGKQ